VRKFNMFIPLTKVDIEQRLVYGLATAEKRDLAGETCHYESTKPFYEKWSGDVQKASGGKSLGNVRAMHGKVAAGKLERINFNDEAKQIEVCAKVVDDNEWNKVLEGVYTGFSQGGSYAKKWTDPKDPATKWYTAAPTELSLVDVPCLKDATFEVIKSGGETELRKFQPIVSEPSLTDVGMKAEELAKAAGSDHTWQEFVEPATAALYQAQIDAALAKVAADDEEEEEESDEDKKKKVEAAKKGKKDDKAEKFVEPKQLWRCNHAEHEHLQKVDAIGCMKSDIALEKVAEVAAPVDAALKKLETIIAGASTEMPREQVIKFIRGWKSGEEQAAEFLVGLAKIVADPKDALHAVLAPLKIEVVQKDNAVVALSDDCMTKMLKAVGPEPEPPADVPLRKGLSQVSTLCEIIQRLCYLQSDLEYEAKYEGDNSKLPGQVQEQAKALCATLRLLVAEETAELFPAGMKVIKFADTEFDLDALLAEGGALVKVYEAELRKIAVPTDEAESLAKKFEDLRDKMPETAVAARAELDKCAVYTRDLVKTGARNSRADVARIQAVHALATELGALCDSGDGAEKLNAGGDLAKVLTENEALRKQFDDLLPRLDALTKQVETFAAQPQPTRAVLKVVSKTNDGGVEIGGESEEALTKRLEAMTPDQRNKELMKISLKFGNNGHPSHYPQQ